MYNDTAQQILLDKLDYEVWLLDFLAKRQDMFEGGIDISLIEITSNKSGAKINDGVAENLGAGAVQAIMDAMAPLVFTASYKMISNSRLCRKGPRTVHFGISFS